MKPCAACGRDAERLDLMNGLLLAAHWNAALGRELTMSHDDGKLLVSSQLGVAGRLL